MQLNVDKIWHYAEQRHRIYLAKEAGHPRAAWTLDPILMQFKFTNNYRELDRTTRVFRETVRDPMNGTDGVLLATIVWRWFNRAEACAVIFHQPDLLDNQTPWEHYYDSGDGSVIAYALRKVFPKGPWVTGAYIIKGKDGMDKLSGVCWCLTHVHANSGWRGVAEAPPATLRELHEWVMSFPYQGSFLAAQVVADLKHTHIGRNATDWHEFAASGPGSRRGLNIAYGRDPEEPWGGEARWHDALLELRQAIAPRFVNEGWPVPCAQDLQNILCEVSKYYRGYSRNVYRG